MKNIVENDLIIKEHAKDINLEINRVDVFQRSDFEKEDGKNNKRLFLTYYCVTKNRLLLGSSENIFEEVYPRIKKIKEDLLQDTILIDKISYEFVIELDDQCYDGEMYEKAIISSYGDSLIKMDELMNKNSYYKELGKDFHILYGIKTNNGTVIGPDAGLLYGSKYILQAFSKPFIRMAEIGAGTCSTPFAISEYQKIDFYYGVDFSPKLQKQYKNVFKKFLDEKGIYSQYIIEDAKSCEFPEEIDLFVVGIYYEAQYDLIVNRGNDIKRSMKKEGVLLLQSGLPENLMFSDLLVAKDKNFWPWQNNNNNLRKYFDCIAQINFKDEIVTICTDNRKDFLVLLKIISENGFKIKNIIY